MPEVTCPSSGQTPVSVTVQREDAQPDADDREDWVWSFSGGDAAHQGWQEALSTLSNGLFATRGALLEATSSSGHYPGTYAAGCFNSTLSTVEGTTFSTESLVNLPNWLPLRWGRLGDDGRTVWLSPKTAEVLEQRHDLDLRHGLLHRTYRVKDEAGLRTRVEETRLVHMGSPHLAAVRLTVTPENWHGTLVVRATLDGAVRNAQVGRYRRFGGQHLTGMETGTHEGVDWLVCHTTATSIACALAARTRLSVTEAPVGTRVRHSNSPVHVATTATCEAVPGQSVVIDKTVALRTARLLAIDHLRLMTTAELRAAPAFPVLLADHCAAWERVWQRLSDDDPPADRLRLRLFRFHLLQVMSPHSLTRDTGVPARALTGEEYHGRIFWDELPVVSWLAQHFPATARSALDYRHRRLPAARRAAAEYGLPGAMYPWQSGYDGSETTVPLVLNPLNGKWSTDHSALQRHIGASLARAVHIYCRTTGDRHYLHGRGAEMILDIAHYFAAAAQYSSQDSRYHLHGVMGPDEFHDRLPHAVTPGLTDNAYTNVLVSHTLRSAVLLWRQLPGRRRTELRRTLELSDTDTENWETVARLLAVPFHDEVISQFSGYERLAPFPFAEHNGEDLSRLDRLLDRDGDHPRNYQVSKQADTLMLGYLFTVDELHEAFEYLGCPLAPGTWKRTVAYYLRRTTHGSTLSAPVHAHVLDAVGHPEAAHFRKLALRVDTRPTSKTAQGIHLGAMAAALQLPHAPPPRATTPDPPPPHP
ncbi:glycoside hydrolase family 65 protein [Streptomyces atroolivaceus]|uniref:glycoside hydrolase family 65 protein n=1 Tax=Streptomyces atroolivaceus TaxID=66869 RepID=UPI0037B2E6B5